MRILADSNIVARAVRAMRAAGHDVLYAGERLADPGDLALLAEAAAEGRVSSRRIMTSARWSTAIRSRAAACCWQTTWADAAAEADLILDALSLHHDRLTAFACLRVGVSGVRETRS